jgi:hypothetical protein
MHVDEEDIACDKDGDGNQGLRPKIRRVGRLARRTESQEHRVSYLTLSVFRILVGVKRNFGRDRQYIPVCILEKLPHALNDKPSTNPPTKPHIIRTMSVCVVSIFARKWRERVAGIVLASWVGMPERDTAVLSPEDQRPGVYFDSSLVGSKRKLVAARSFGYRGGVPEVCCAVFLGGSILSEAEGGWPCIMVCMRIYKVPILFFKMISLQ